MNIPYSKLAKVTNDFDACPREEGGFLIGKGGSSTVFYARADNDRDIAIKRFKCDRTHAADQFNNEMKLLPGLTHDNILPLLGYSVDSDCYKCLVYPFMPNGCLNDRLACKNGSPPLDVQTRLRIVIALAEVLNFIHEKGYVHRDVKSANILLSAHFKPRLGDFGIARQSISLVDEQDTDTQVAIGSIGYMAPESIEHNISCKLDVFSFGVILLEILTGQKPYDNTRQSDDEILYDYVPDTVEEFNEGQYLDEKAGRWDAATVSRIFHLARRCLQRRKKSRPNMEEIVSELGESKV